MPPALLATLTARLRRPSGESAAAPSAGAERIGRRPALVALLVLLALYSLLAVRQMALVGPTVDEPTYFNTGRIIRNEGWDQAITHLHGPIPYYMNQLFVGSAFPAGGFSKKDANRKLLLRGRLGTLPFGWLALVLCYVWAARVFGRAGGLVAATLFALNPLMIGYGGLLAVDMVHTGALMLALWLAWRALLSPTLARAALAGAGLGVAFATKYLALFAGPPVVLAIAIRRFLVARRAGPAGGGRPLLGALGLAVLVPALALLALHACYGFRVGLAPADPGAYRSELISGLVGRPVVGRLLRLFPAPYLAGVDFQMGVGEDAHYVPYLNGSFAPRHPGYYAWSFLLKTPELVVALALWLFLFRVPRWLAGRGSLEERTTAWLLLPVMAIFLGYLSLMTGLQIGIRYVLPLYPILFVMLGALARAVWTRRLSGRGMAAVLLVLAGAQGVEVAREWPDLLGYFNTLAGGQGAAWRHFDDSNSDWGQMVEDGLAELRATETRPFEVLSSFDGPRFGRVAIKLRDFVQHDPEHLERARHWLFALEAVRHVGAGWWLFDVTREAFEASVAASGDERARADLVVAYAGAGELGDARRHLALLPPERAEPLAELLRLAAASEAPDAAADVLRRAVDAWERVGRLDRAEELLRERAALRAAPDSTRLLARVLTKEGRIEDAIELLESSGDPAASPGALMLAGLYVQRDRPGDAVRLLERVPPDSPLAAAARTQLETLRVEAEKRARFDEALR